MGKRFKKEKAGEFDTLPEEWKSKVEVADIDGVKAEIVKTATAQAILEAAKALDPDLANLKEQLKTANTQYVEGRKSNKLKMRMLIQRWGSLGAPGMPDVQDFLKQVTKEAANQVAPK